MTQHETPTQQPVLQIKARTQRHPAYPERFPLDESCTGWDTIPPGYRQNRPFYETPELRLASWAEAPEGFLARSYLEDIIEWNELADDTPLVERPFDLILAKVADPEDWSKVDFTARGDIQGNPLTLDKRGLPQNPCPTGMDGRGVLGKYGPNFAADPIITRFNPESGQLEMVAILRGDGGGWAIPGGMVDSGETTIAAGKREALEEALAPGQDLDDILANEKATPVYRGIVDDWRNTDVAWMETQAYHWHLSDEEGAALKLEADDDAQDVQWMPMTQENIESLYASHGTFVKEALERLRGTYPKQVTAVLGSTKHRATRVLED